MVTESYFHKQTLTKFLLCQHIWIFVKTGNKASYCLNRFFSYLCHVLVSLLPILLGEE